MVRKSLYLVTLLMFLFGCRQSEESKKRETKNNVLRWIEGNYEYVSNEGVYRECWKKMNDGEYFGKGYFLHKGDTSFLMRMRLFADTEGVKMEYNVRGQNGGNDVAFTLTRSDNKVYVFENPFRGFPSVMQYKLLSDSLITVLEKGFENNKTETKEFTIRKVGDIK